MASICTKDLVVVESLLDIEIGKDAYDMDEILKLLYENWPEFRKTVENDRVKKLTATEISDGKGLLSHVYRLDLIFEGGKQLDIVLKVPTGLIETHVEKENEEENLDFNAHSVECDVYELFKSQNLPGMPLVYYTERASLKKPGLIIMENLSVSYDTLALTASATIEQCWNMLRMIARLQARVMSNNDVKWKGRFRDRSHTNVFYDTFIDSFIPLLLEDHPEFKPLVDEMNCITNKKFGRYALLDRPAELGATSFNHGDMWFNNVFMEKNGDSSLGNCPKIFVDWQLVHEGNPMFDFCRFVTIASDAEVRREIQPRAANKFYDMLIEEYAKLGHKDFKPNYNREQLQELFDLAYLQQSTLFLVAPPFTRVNPTNRDDSPSVLEAKIEKIKLRTRLNCEDAIKLIKKYQFDKQFG